MDDFAFLRFLKPVAAAIIMAAATFYLSGSGAIALLAALIPLLLGWLAIMSGFAYRLTALILIAAVIWAIIPLDARHVIGEQVASLEDIVQAEAAKVPDASPSPSPPAVAPSAPAAAPSAPPPSNREPKASAQ